MEKVRQREIKFRCWDTVSERMIEPSIFQPSSDYDRIEGDDRFNAPFTYYETWQDVDDGLKRPCYVMQYTGLKDKDGRDIFEGDVIQAIGSEGSKIRHEIIFDDGGFCAKNITYQNIGKLTQKWIHELEFEIIGNIYEPPHLLSQGEIKTELI